MAHAAISPALRGWEGPAGREEAGRRGNNTYPMSREEQPHRAIHGEGEDVEQLFGSSLQRLKGTHWGEHSSSSSAPP